VPERAAGHLPAELRMLLVPGRVGLKGGYFNAIFSGSLQKIGPFIHLDKMIIKPKFNLFHSKISFNQY
jgi:hypothetical protein